MCMGVCVCGGEGGQVCVDVSAMSFNVYWNTWELVAMG